MKFNSFHLEGKRRKTFFFYDDIGPKDPEQFQMTAQKCNISSVSCFVAAAYWNFIRSFGKVNPISFSLSENIKL
jgi:hypothetical protein